MTHWCWEYKKVALDGYDLRQAASYGSSDLSLELRTLGQQGWEVFQVLCLEIPENVPKYMALLRRPLKPYDPQLESLKQ
jgi:hypothetical protein